MLRVGLFLLVLLGSSYQEALRAKDIGIAMANKTEVATTQESDLTKPIQESIDSYVAAFNAGDAQAVASHWKEDGEFTLPAGDKLSGQEEIKTAFADYFEITKGAKLELLATEITLLSPNVGIESGMARVVSPDGKVNDTQYQAVHLSTDAGWKIDSLQEADAPSLPMSNYQKLKGLEWMIGEWVDQSETATITTNCRWTSNQNFLVRSFKVEEAGGISFEGTQVIGWDPASNAIRSWLFDSDGGFGVGMWRQSGTTWIVRTLNTLSDGRKASATNIYEQIDEQTMTFRSIGRQVDGELMPKIEPITITRQ